MESKQARTFVRACFIAIFKSLNLFMYFSEIIASNCQGSYENGLLKLGVAFLTLLAILLPLVFRTAGRAYDITGILIQPFILIKVVI